MKQKFIQCDNSQCELLADDFFANVYGNSNQSRFNNAISDIVDVYPKGILIGAIAASKYIRYPIIPRMTYDVDILLPETEFEMFLDDEIPDSVREKLETHFADSDSAMHSMKHRQTGIYVDFLSVQSKPVRKKLIRYILNNRKQTTNILKVGETRIEIVKPEILIALKLHRYNKNRNTEKGLSDRLDIIKILKTLCTNDIPLEISEICERVTKEEFKQYNQIAADVECEMTCEECMDKDNPCTL
ncbi:MAG: hypothetical protein GXP53_07110 [Deltaproteobacteria bacterium]|nr:hypothetical protein [Deltaproteobacteria bacterium]